MVPYADFEFLPGKAKMTGKASSTAWMVLSEDGGVSFGKPRKIQTMQYNLDDKKGRKLSVFPAFAVDNQSKEYRDRIYVAWTDFRYGPIRLLFSHSEDRGLHWSEPMLLDPGTPKDAMQGQPVVAVNKDGIVGVTWYDTRDSKDGSQFHEYFTASLDGGKSFLPPIRVSSAPSTPLGPGNMNMGAMIFRHKETTALSLVSAGSRWPGGGDYMGLAAGQGRRVSSVLGGRADGDVPDLHGVRFGRRSRPRRSPQGQGPPPLHRPRSTDASGPGSDQGGPGHAPRVRLRPDALRRGHEGVGDPGSAAKHLEAADLSADHT